MNTMNPLKQAQLLDLKTSMQRCTDELREIISLHLQDNGLKCYDCQRICFENAINELEALTNGLSADDLK